MRFMSYVYCKWLIFLPGLVASVASSSYQGSSLFLLHLMNTNHQAACRCLILLIEMSQNQAHLLITPLMSSEQDLCEVILIKNQLMLILQ